MTGLVSRHTDVVQPVSTLMFFVGYLLALPIAFRMTSVVAKQHRMALTGHQTGVGLAAVGWLTRGAIVIALIHVAWIVGVRIWFSANPGSNSG